MAHSQAGLKTQNPDLDEYKSAKSKNQFSVHRHQNREELSVLANDQTDQARVPQIQV